MACNEIIANGVDESGQITTKMVLDRLLKAHEPYFDVTRNYRYAGKSFPGYAEFHSTTSQYVLIKRAKLWEASEHEYMFFELAGQLTKAILERDVDFIIHKGINKIELDPDHMSSYLTLIIIADEFDDEVAKEIKHTHFRKNFMFGLKGWTDLRLAAVNLSDSSVISNYMGKDLKPTLEANSFLKAGR
ncbi:MAG: hypothetical protein LUB61_01885 [Eggerthellaceae bacterium]|nr:hypothetical protein [Eggerthellaceae bacterium]